MQNYNSRRFAHRDRQFESLLLLTQLGTALMGGIFLFLGILLFLSMSYGLLYAGRIFPGISVAGVDISGMKPADAAAKLSAALTYPYKGKVVFRDSKGVWVANPAQLGMVFDAQGSANAAYRYGRSFNPLQSIQEQITAVQFGADLPPQSIFDQRIAYLYLQQVAHNIDQPVREASLSIDGINVVAQPGQVGRLVNVDATLARLNAQLITFRDGEVALMVTEQAPSVLSIDQQIQQARQLLASPFIITIPNMQSGDPGPWALQPDELASMLKVAKINTDTGSTFHLELDRIKLQMRLNEIARAVDRDYENARFTFNDETKQLELIQSSKTGRSVNIQGSIDAIQNAISQGQPGAALQLDLSQPLAPDTASAPDLGITQNIMTYTSYFRGSTSSRMKNIEQAAARFHGVLVAPGETFSMGKTLGDVSLDNGYAEAMIIYGGRTIKGVGGGVCQVSTTLFRAVFFAGFPIAERHAHAYRVSYYEQSKSGIDRNLSGLDATVYFPLVDFKFTNDTKYWMLMETYFNPTAQTLTWKLYSTSDGRTVQWETTGPQNITAPPPPLIQLNTDLNPGEFKQVDWAAEGADIIVNRTVYLNNVIHFVDKVITNYQPWRDICEYGPGVEDPEKVAKKRNLCWQ